MNRLLQAASILNGYRIRLEVESYCSSKWGVRRVYGAPGFVIHFGRRSAWLWMEPRR